MSEIVSLPRTPPRVLAVEDNPATLALLRHLVEQEGWTFDGAGEGYTGLRLAQENPPTLLLLDIQLPVFDGLEFLRLLRGRPEGQGIPTIIISEVQDRLRHQMEALKLGAERYFSKPFDPGQLIATARGLMREYLAGTETFEGLDSRTGGREPSISPANSIRDSTAPGQLPHLQRRQQAEFCGYRISESLGSGGMATVYRAEKTATGQPVALKVLLQRHTGSATHVERFRREAKVMMELRHPNIISVYEDGSTEHFYYIAMELVNGHSLLHHIDKKMLKPRDYRSLVPSLAAPLAFLHGQGLVHRDVKPANYLMTPDFTPKLGDFGLVRTERYDRLTADKSLLGSFAYMSPEQKRDAARVDHRSDIYSLAITYYELLVGDLPDLRYVPPHTVNPVCKPSLEKVFERGFDPTPESRYQTVAELRDAVLEGLEPV